VNQEDFQTLFETYFPLATDDKGTTRDEWRTPRQPSIFIHFQFNQSIIEKVGGIGRQVEFEITSIGTSHKITAVQLKPISSYRRITDDRGHSILEKDSYIKFWSRNQVPMLVLATRKGGRPIDANYLQNWREVPKSIENRRFMARVTLKQEIQLVSKRVERSGYRREKKE